MLHQPPPYPKYPHPHHLLSSPAISMVTAAWLMTPYQLQTQESNSPPSAAPPPRGGGNFCRLDANQTVPGTFSRDFQRHGWGVGCGSYKKKKKQFNQPNPNCTQTIQLRKQKESKQNPHRPENSLAAYTPAAPPPQLLLHTHSGRLRDHQRRPFIFIQSSQTLHLYHTHTHTHTRYLDSSPLSPRPGSFTSLYFHLQKKTERLISQATTRTAAKSFCSTPSTLPGKGEKGRQGGLGKKG